jgi:repressor LexA
MSEDLTKRQREVLEYIQFSQGRQGFPPSLREIAAHFGFSSPNAALDHVKALRIKGALATLPGRARSLRILIPKRRTRKENLEDVVSIPIYGSIPAGLPSEGAQDDEGCVLVDVNTIGIRPTARTFGLRVRGDSMVGKHVLDGDLAIIEHGVEPRTGDIVAALIDGQVTLKTFMLQRGRPFLRAENPRFPNLIPQQELQIQGVMVALVRKRKA